MSMKTLKFMNVIFIICFSLSFSQVNSKDPCSEPQASQFDFWVGEWKAEWKDPEGNIKTGSNRIYKILNGCVIEENFSGHPAMEFEGKSYSVYNPEKKMWQQTWVDNSGNYMLFTGGMQDDKMILKRKTQNEDGDTINFRMVFYDIKSDSFNWDWQRSTDNGEKWDLIWSIKYNREK